VYTLDSQKRKTSITSLCKATACYDGLNAERNPALILRLDCYSRLAKIQTNDKEMSDAIIPEVCDLDTFSFQHTFVSDQLCLFELINSDFLQISHLNHVYNGYCIAATAVLLRMNKRQKQCQGLLRVQDAAKGCSKSNILNIKQT
jgi:hypothetical protein